MEQEAVKKGNPWALLPIGVFLVVYIGISIWFGSFYSMPVVVAFLIAIVAACFQNRKLKFDDKLGVMANGLADKNIMTMIMIFLAAGVFVGVLGRSSASSAAYFLLSMVPARFAVVVLFVVSCFVSTAMGTSCGTITFLVPIAVNVSDASGFPIALCVGSVVGGAMFGDNLSFISDTTIAACSTQGCRMKDKFRENFLIALPAAIVTIGVILLLSMNVQINESISGEYNLVQLIPYVLVLIGGIIGINVFVVLLAGILSGVVIMMATGAVVYTDLFANMGAGAAGMYETILVTVLVSAMCGLIREYGGFDALLYAIRKVFRGSRGGQLGVGVLVSAMDVATANNTVAIVMAGPIAREISTEYGISSTKTASILDIFASVIQGILPYGAQLLLAVGAVTGMGGSITAVQIIPYLFYPYLLLVSVLVTILFIRGRSKKNKKAAVQA